MLSDFDQKFLIDNYRKDLYRFQLYGHKPSLLGLISLDNVFDTTGYLEYMGGVLESGNTIRGLEEFETYKRKLHIVLNYLIQQGDLPVYPSKDVFLQMLYINGEYKCLNLAGVGMADSTYSEADGIVCELTHFEPYQYDKWHGGRRDAVTRIRKGNVIRFFNKTLHSVEHFDDRSCYLTLSMKNISDDEFNEMFKASKFMPGYIGKEPAHYEIHKFIKRLVEDGEEFNKQNPCKANHKAPPDLNYFRCGRHEAMFKDEQGRILSFAINQLENKDIHAGTELYIEGENRIVTSIELYSLTVRCVHTKISGR